MTANDISSLVKARYCSDPTSLLYGVGLMAGEPSDIVRTTDELRE